MKNPFARYAVYMVFAALILALAVNLTGCGDVSTVQNPVSAEVQIPPKPAQGFVGDTTGKLSDADIASLNQHAQQIKAAYDVQIGVSLTDSGGRSIKEVSTNTARAWGVGSKESNRGVLIQIFPNERKSRLEVSRHFEHIFTDGISGETLRVARPEFQSGKFAAGVHKIMDAVAQRAATNTAKNGRQKTYMFATITPFLGLGLGGGLLLLLNLAAVIIFFVIRARRRREEEEALDAGTASSISSSEYGATLPYSSRYTSGARRRYAEESSPVVDEDSGLTSAIIAGSALSQADQQTDESTNTVSTFEPAVVESEPALGGSSDFGGAGATDSWSGSDNDSSSSSSSDSGSSSYSSYSSGDSGSSSSYDSGSSSSYDSGSSSSDSGSSGGSDSW